MAERQIRRAPSYRNPARRKPEDIYVEQSNTYPHTVPAAAPDALILTPDVLSPGLSSLTFSVQTSPVPFSRTPGLPSAGLQSDISSPRNFYLEKPPAEYYEEAGHSPVSPGVTVLLSPTGYDDDSDTGSMDFFKAATYSGPRQLQIAEAKPQKRQKQPDVKTKAPKLGLPSPKTPKAWPSMTEPDISTLPSRNVLEASSKLAGEIYQPTQSRRLPEPARKRSPPPVANHHHTVSAAPKVMLSRPPTTRSPPLEKAYRSNTSAEPSRRRSFSDQQAFVPASHDLPLRPATRSPPPQTRAAKPHESWKRRSRSFGDEQQSNLLLLRQQSRSPSNDSQKSGKSSRSSSSERSKRGQLYAQSGSNGSRTLSRTSSPVFDGDDTDCTDFESVSDFTSEDEDSFCEPKAAPPEDFYRNTVEKEKETLPFRYQQSHAVGSQSKFLSHSQSTSNLSKTAIHHIRGTHGGSNDRFRNDTYLQPSYSQRQISDEYQSRSQYPAVAPPPRKRSPPTIPIHQDETKADGAPFAPPDSRSPRTLVSNWLAGISLVSSRNDGSSSASPRDQHEFAARKPRIWGRKQRRVSREGQGGWI